MMSWSEKHGSPSPPDPPESRSQPAAALPPGLLPAPYAHGAAPEIAEVLVPLRQLPATDEPSDVVILVDGLGAELLSAHLAEAPTLRGLQDVTRVIRTVFPATTATALATLLTGAAPLSHGIIGYRGLSGAAPTRGPRPMRPVTVNQLTGSPHITAETWPLTRAGDVPRRPLLQIAPRKHAGSHLSRALHAEYTPVIYARRDERVEATVRALRGGGNGALAYLHLDDVDHAGHQHGPDSPAWREALAEVDATIGALLRRLPAGTRVHITADHGMVTAVPAQQIDLATDPALSQHVDVLAGDPRAPMLCLPGGESERREHAHTVSQLLLEKTEGRCSVLDRDEMLRSELLGPPAPPSSSSPGGHEAAQQRAIPQHSLVSPAIQDRLGDLMVLFAGEHTLVDSRLRDPRHPPEVGVHGALTAAESLVPFITAVV